MSQFDEIKHVCYYCNSLETKFCKLCGKWFCSVCRKKYAERIKDGILENFGVKHSHYKTNER